MKFNTLVGDRVHARDLIGDFEFSYSSGTDPTIVPLTVLWMKPNTLV